jgi:histone H3/H4
MNAQQIAALSQIQAQAIVNARPQTALLASGTPTIDKNGKPVQPTQAQIQHQIQLQAQALVHAHTQAQIAAGIYKGDTAAPTPAAIPTPVPMPIQVSKTQSSLSMGTTIQKHPLPHNGNPLLTNLTPAQLAQQNKLTQRHAQTKELVISRHNSELGNLRTQFQQQNLGVAPTPDSQVQQGAQMKAMTGRQSQEISQLNQTLETELKELHTEFRKQNAAAEYAGLKVATLPNPSRANTVRAGTALAIPQQRALAHPGAPTSVLHPYDSHETGGTVTSATSPAFLEKLSNSLNHFWTDQLRQMRNLGTTVPQTEQDFKNHNDLPLARIKRIMKSDEDVRMISAEAPVLFAKACEMFILELTFRSWSYSENNKRRTLQKEDIREAIQRTDILTSW